MSEAFFEYIALGDFLSANKLVQTPLQKFILMQQQGNFIQHTKEYLIYFNSIPPQSPEYNKALTLKFYIDLFHKEFTVHELLTPLFDDLSNSERMFFTYLEVYNIAKYRFFTNQMDNALNLLDHYINEIESPNYLARLYNFKGLILNDREEYLDAIDVYNTALYITKKANIQRLVNIVKGNLADCYINYGELDAAEAIFSQLIDIFINANDYNNAAYSLELLGKLTQYKGNYNKAEQYYLSACEISIQVDNRRRIAHSYFALANLAANRFSYEKSNKYLQLADEIYNNNFITRTKIYLQYIENYINLNDLQSAKQFLKKMKDIRNSSKEQSVENMTQVAEALIWKAHPRMYQKSIAFDILKSMVKNPPLPLFLQLKTLSMYLELLILELLIKENTILQIEIAELISRIVELATIFRSPIISLELLRITALFYLNSMQFPEYKTTLAKIQELPLSSKLLQPIVDELETIHTKFLNDLVSFETKNSEFLESKRVEFYMEYLSKVSNVITNISNSSL